MDKNQLIGNGNKLPWHLPNDMKRFKQLTTGKVVVMGRKTYESIGKPLSKRRNIVLTKTGKHIKGVELASSIAQVITLSQNEKEIFIIGGANVYSQFFDKADKLYITYINHAFQGDVYFPTFSLNNFKIIYEEKCLPDEKNLFEHTFKEYSRKTDN